MRILITGGRDYKRESFLLSTLNIHTEDTPHVTIVTGGCPTGADAIAKKWAEKNSSNVSLEEYPADWNKYGKAAGPIRNQHMVNLGADYCLAFPTGGRGTAHCIKAAKESGIETIVF